MYDKNELLRHLDKFTEYATDTAGFEIELLQSLVDMLRQSIEKCYSVAIDNEDKNSVLESFLYTPVEALADSIEEIEDEETGIILYYHSDAIYSIILALDAEATGYV